MCYINKFVGTKDIIEQTELSDSTVRKILRKFLQDKKIETTDSHYKLPNKKYKLTEMWQSKRWPKKNTSIEALVFFWFCI